HDWSAEKEIRSTKLTGGSKTDRPVPMNPLPEGTTQVDPTPVFNPDGTLLVTPLANGQILMWDVATGKRLRVYLLLGEEHNGMTFSKVAFNKDGKNLLGLSQDGKVHVWDSDSLEEQPTLEVSQQGIFAACVRPDGKAMAGIQVDQTLIVWETDTGKALASFKVEEGEGMAMRPALAFSPDGKYLASGLQSGRIRIHDAASGAEKTKNGPRHQFLSAGFSENAKTIVTIGPNTITTWSAISGKSVNEKILPGGKARVAVLARGCGHACLGQEEDMAMKMIDCRKGEIVEGIQGQGWQGLNSIAFSPRKNLFACPDSQDVSQVKLWSVETGKEIRSFRSEPGMGGPLQLLFSDDGRILITNQAGQPNLECWEVATGLRRKTIRLPFSGGIENPAAGAADVAPPPPPPGAGGGAFINVPFGTPFLPGMAASPDQKSLAVPQMQRIALLSLTTSRVEKWLHGPDRPINNLTFSPDGRWLCASAIDRKIYLWNVRSGELKATLEGHRGIINTLEFASNSKQFLSTSEDGTVLVWDVEACLRIPPVTERLVAARPFEQAWKDLASDDSIIAEKAINEMVSHPSVALPGLKKNLQPVPAVSRDRLSKLIADLDSNEAATRDQAVKELEAIDELAGPALREAMKSGSAEVKRRVSRLIENLDRKGITGEQARPLRAIEVLEKIGSAECRELLEKLSGGAAESVLTRDASDSLSRLANRTGP
ncbi:MAG: hypothetical protein ACKO23_06875, partial [Gemmataceae bacterium]